MDGNNTQAVNLAPHWVPASPTLPAERSADLDKLATALAKAQSKIEGAVKDKSNPAFRSKYADLGAVWDAIREPLSENGLSIVQFPRRTPTGVAVKTILMHASGQWISGEMEVPCAKQDAHGVGSATTYARRFSLSAVVGVAPMDDDGNGAAGKMPAIERVDPADRHLVQGNGQSAYEVNKAKNGPPGRVMAELWASKAKTLFEQPGYTLDALKEWYAEPCTNGGTKNNRYKLVELREKHPDLADKVDVAIANIREVA